jgi:CheY-like chemotaxis protein
VTRHQLRILVVDDMADAADSLGMLLEMWGNDVRVAYSGFAALELAKGYQPDVALLDIGMPGMDGFQVGQRCRALPGLEGILLIGISGYASPSDHQRARELGFDHYLVKPVDPIYLRDLLSAAGRESQLSARYEASTVVGRSTGVLESTRDSN